MFYFSCDNDMSSSDILWDRRLYTIHWFIYIWRKRLVRLILKDLYYLAVPKCFQNVIQIDENLLLLVKVLQSLIQVWHHGSIASGLLFF